MRAVIIPPPLIPNSRENPYPVYPPLGPMSMATVARQAGHDVALCDLNLARCRGDLPDSADWHEAAAEYILALEPDIVGFGTMCSSFAATILIAKATKALRPSLPMVFGGPQATMVYRDLMVQIPEVDFVLAGEADYSLAQFLNTFYLQHRPKTPGLAQREGGEITLEPTGSPLELDSLPMIDYSLWPIREALEKGWYRQGIPIDAGRGCPYRCSFCTTSKYFRRKYRMKPPVKLKQEIISLYRNYGFTAFKLTHDSFTVNREHVLEIAKELGECEVPGLSWTCSARADTVDCELLEIMWNGRCRRLFFGIETGSARMQKTIGKLLNLSAVEPLLLHALEVGFGFTVSFIIGFPEEEWSDVEATLTALLRWSGIDSIRPQLHLLAPSSGTRVFDEYGDMLQFDSWFPDSLYFNKMCPERETAFVKEHPQLCPECHFIPNARVDRRELVEIREFTRLLTHVLPGIGPFLLNTEPSILDLLNRWRERCAGKGLPAPDVTGFFSFTAEHHVPYLRTLLEDLEEKQHLSKTHRSFLKFWDRILDLKSDLAFHDVEEAPGTFMEFQEIPRGQEMIPIVTRKCALAILDHDIDECLKNWMERGIWNWPESRTVYYLLVEEEDRLQINKLKRVAAMVFNWCHGEHTLSDLYALVEALSDIETESLKQTMGSISLTLAVIKSLGDIAELRFVPINNCKSRNASI